MDITNFILSLVDRTQVEWLAILLIATFIVGVLAAIVLKEVTLSDFKNIWVKVGIILTAYLVASLLAVKLTDWEFIRTTMFASLIAYLASCIIKNLKALFAAVGINIPIPDAGTIGNFLVKK